MKKSPLLILLLFLAACDYFPPPPKLNGNYVLTNLQEADTPYVYKADTLTYCQKNTVLQLEAVSNNSAQLTYRQILPDSAKGIFILAYPVTRNGAQVVYIETFQQQ